MARLLLLIAVTAVTMAAGCTCGGAKTREGRGDRPAVVVVDPDEAQRPKPVLEVEPNDGRKTAQRLPGDRPVEGSITAVEDQDWYAVPPPTGEDERILKATLTGVKDQDLALEAYDEAGKRLVRVNNSRVGGGEVLVNLTVAAGSTTYLRVRPAGKQPPAGQGRYRLWHELRPREEGEEREPNWKAELATPLELDQEAVGFLGWHTDNDWYQVTLPEGLGPASRIRVEFDGLDDVPANLAVWLGKTRLQERWGRTGKSIVLANLALGGTKDPAQLFVVVRSRYHANVESRYSLRIVSSIPPMGTEAEPNDTPQTATPLALGAAQAGILADDKDHDHYRIKVDQATHVKVEATAPMGLDLALALLDGSGSVLVEVNEGRSRQAEILPAIWITPPGGVVRVRAPKRGDVNAVSAYHVKAAALGGQRDLEREPNNDAKAATAWILGAPISGFLYPADDVDHYVVQAQGERLRLAISAVPKLAFKLELLEPGGAAPLGVGSSTKPGEGAAVEASTTMGGRYLLKVTETTKSCDARRSYQLTSGENP